MQTRLRIWASLQFIDIRPKSPQRLSKLKTLMMSLFKTQLNLESRFYFISSSCFSLRRDLFHLPSLDRIHKKRKPGEYYLGYNSIGSILSFYLYPLPSPSSTHKPQSSLPYRTEVISWACCQTMPSWFDATVKC